MNTATNGPGRTTHLADLALALVAGLLAAVGTIGANDGHIPGALAFTLVGIAAAPLAMRRRWPLAALLASMAALWAYVLLGCPQGPIFLLPALVLFFFVAASSTGRILAVVPPLAAAAMLLHWLDPAREVNVSVNAMITVLWLGVPTLAGSILREARRARARARQAERERHRADERVAMAREIHDVVGHSLAVVSMNAGVALHVLDKRSEAAPAGVAEHLHAIRDASTRALDDLRATLVPLREGRQSELRPAFDLDDLDALVDDVRQGGLDVEWSITGDRAAVPAAVAGTAYRVVQEALTNVIRHAGASRAHVRIDCGPDALILDVRDDGRGGEVDPDDAGQGLTGMMERVEARGGIFSTGPAPEGGFAVRAEIPYRSTG